MSCILSIETSTNICSVAMSNDGECIFNQENHQGPIIISGDFNAWNERRLNLVNNLMQKYGLDAVTLSQDERLRFLGYPLDYIFTRGVKVVSATSEVVTSSDHNPLLVEFELE